MGFFTVKDDKGQEHLVHTSQIPALGEQHAVTGSTDPDTAHKLQELQRQAAQQQAWGQSVTETARPQPALRPGDFPHTGFLKAAIAGAGAWRPEHGDVTRVPQLIEHSAEAVDLFHRIHRAADIHHARDVERLWETCPGKRLQFIPTDADIMAIPEKLWREVFQRTPTADGVNQYVSEVNDCDKHAQLFSGLCAAMWYLNGVGQIIDWSGSHSYNAVLVAPADGDEGDLPTIRIVEPQQSGFVEATSLHKAPYTLERGLVLFG